MNKFFLISRSVSKRDVTGTELSPR